MASTDGRIDCDMTEKIEPGNDYYEALDSLNVPTTLFGKTTALLHYVSTREIHPNETPLTKECFWKAEDTDGYTVVADNRGVLAWNDSIIDDKPLICLLSEKASIEYLGCLRQMGISYIATGKESVDLNRAVEILAEEFGVKRMGIVGGGKINAGFLDAGLLDEMSLMIAPGIDGRSGQPSVFDGRDEKSEPIRMKIKSCTSFDNGMIWVRYNINEVIK